MGSNGPDAANGFTGGVDVAIKRVMEKNRKEERVSKDPQTQDQIIADLSNSLDAAREDADLNEHQMDKLREGLAKLEQPKRVAAQSLESLIVVASRILSEIPIEDKVEHMGWARAASRIHSEADRILKDAFGKED